MRFREDELIFKVTDPGDNKPAVAGATKKETEFKYDYPEMTKTLGNFKLNIEPGSFKPSEIMMMLGQNGTGKTTFIKILAGILKPDDEELELPRLAISYKP